MGNVEFRLLVIIGFTAAFIVMLFPNPVSSRVLVRKTLAATINETGDIFATEVEAFLSEEALTHHAGSDEVDEDDEAERHSEDPSSKEERVKSTGQRVIVVVVCCLFFSWACPGTQNLHLDEIEGINSFAHICEIRASIVVRRFTFFFLLTDGLYRGIWPEVEYRELFDVLYVIGFFYP